MLKLRLGYLGESSLEIANKSYDIKQTEFKDQSTTSHLLSLLLVQDVK